MSEQAKPDMRGPLARLRVVDLTNDLGRFATKLLAESGASVVRVGCDGDRGPAMRDADAAALGGLLDWWYDGGKIRLPLDLDDPAARETYRRLVQRADLVIDSERPGRLRALGIDHSAMTAANPSLVQVSLTPFGQDGPWAQWHTSDLVAAALGGVLSVSGSPEQAINPYGRQSLQFGSFMAAICGLAGVYAVRAGGIGQHIDLSLHEVVATTIEQLWFQYWFADVLPYPPIAPRRGALHWLGAYDVKACRTGWQMICPTPIPGHLFAWMAEEGVGGAAERAAMSAAEAVADIDEVMRMTAEFVATKDSGALFLEAQRRHIAFGEVQTIAQVAANPQHEFREFFQAVPGTPVVRPRSPVRFHGTPAGPPQPPGPVAAPADVLSGWPIRDRPEAGPGAGARRPLDGLRVLDLTWVLAGPFCCRMLGDLGADIVKVQTAERATLVNNPEFPYYYCWNRSKRSVTLNMKHEGALAIARRLVEASDVVIENYSAGVLARWGLDYETVASWNPRIVYVTLSGCGHEGPWQSMITYAPTIHALCGLTHLSNPPGRGDIGAGFSLNDHAAGFQGAVAVLSAIEARHATGVGQHVDISQFEVGSYLVGGALTDYVSNDREARPRGNADAFTDFAVNDVFRCREGELAVTARTRAELRAVIGDADLAGWCAARDAHAAMVELQTGGIAAASLSEFWAIATHPDSAGRPSTPSRRTARCRPSTPRRARRSWGRARAATNWS